MRFDASVVWPARDLSPDETRIANSVSQCLTELRNAGFEPTHCAVHRTLFLRCSTLLGLHLVRVGYMRKDEAALMVIVDDVVRPSEERSK